METLNHPATEDQSVALDKDGFDSAKWLSYFIANKRTRPIFSLPPDLELDEQIKLPLIRSLQRFQIGETGDGKHLRKFASRANDADYSRCVDLFIREEQSHGQLLGEVVLSLGGTLLTWHWTDVAFIFLRRILGLKTEILILQIAEIIGKCFYKCVADKVENETLREVFSVIVLDEIAHMHFHSEFLAKQLGTLSWMTRVVVHYAWCVIFNTACFVFILDHKASLDALGISSSEFVARCSKEFHRSARIAFK
ncbi:MAG: hypothetical protein K2W95_15065 [Candidatus Obscuribacterales bacterium]|nr:hypothetical protein [Candidatus Obscuribacterales bacterium]